MSTKTISSDLANHTEGNDLLSTKLPVTHNLKLGYLFSLSIAVLTAVASITGILYPQDIYPTAELRQSFAANDVVILFIGLFLPSLATVLLMISGPFYLARFFLLGRDLVRIGRNVSAERTNHT